MDKDVLVRVLLWIAVAAIAIYTSAMTLLPTFSAMNVTKESVEVYINGLAAFISAISVAVAVWSFSIPQRRQERDAHMKARLVAMRRLPAVNDVLRAASQLWETTLHGRTPEEVVVALHSEFEALPDETLTAISDEDVFAMTAALPDAGWNIGRSIAVLQVVGHEVRGIHRRNHIAPAMRLSTGETPPERWRAALYECAINLQRERQRIEALAKWHPGDIRFD